MREIRQSGSEGGGNEQTVSPYPYLVLNDGKKENPTHFKEVDGVRLFESH